MRTQSGLVQWQGVEVMISSNYVHSNSSIPGDALPRHGQRVRVQGNPQIRRAVCTKATNWLNSTQLA